MRVQKLSEDQTVQWVIFFENEEGEDQAIAEIYGWGITKTTDLNQAKRFDSEKEAFEMRDTIAEGYPNKKGSIYIDCVLCNHNQEPV